ncbi:MAG: response regulator [Chitinispirillaceae bacterium]|nr:response regulator [Chitinispirillaceae bacterium]
MASGRKRILWADDEIEYLRSHIMFLETRGYSVVPVFCGDDAIELVSDKPQGFDLVLLDEQMPGKSGLTTLEKIKEINSELPVVMVTKSEEEQLMDDALGKKIDGYLTKPVNPSQILLVCKNLLDSRKIVSKNIAQRFIRSYSENRSLLSGHLSPLQWIKLYENVTGWDLALESVDDEGIRQTHSGQKSDCNAHFSSTFIENYAHWIKDETEGPLLSTGVIEQHVAPLLAADKRTYLIVLSGMRLDQYIGIESVLKKFFRVDRHYFYSTLPTDDTFARAALFSGKLPSDIAAENEEQLSLTEDSDSVKTHLIEEQLLSDHLARLGHPVPVDEPWFTRITDRLEPEHLLSRIESCRNSKLITFVVNFFDQVRQVSTASGIMQELTNDESGMRALTRSWFKRSALLHFLREVATQDCRVVVMSDHGSVLCSRGTELYCSKSLTPNLRYKFGNGISSDERTVVYLADPTHFGIPKFGNDTACVIARENYYFIQPDKFEHYNRHYRNTFQQGGISMEEIIVPLGILTPGAD